MKALTKSLLSNYLSSEKNIDIIQRHISNSTTTEEDYKRLLYNVLGWLMKETDVKTVASNLKNKRIFWQAPDFDNVAERIKEHDNYIVTPFEVVDGVVTCNKCGSNRTWSVQRQTRSSDEPMTTFSKCADCGHQQVYAG